MRDSVGLARLGSFPKVGSAGRPLQGVCACVSLAGMVQLCAISLKGDPKKPVRQIQRVAPF